jgi:hypothetical protein
MRKLGKDDQTHRHERRRARDSLVDQRDNAIGIGRHLPAIDRVREVGLAGRNGISQGHHGLRRSRP